MSDTGPDLVVAGAGGGLVAALRAAPHGLDVLVVDASEHHGASGYLAGNGLLPALGLAFLAADHVSRRIG